MKPIPYRYINVLSLVVFTMILLIVAIRHEPGHDESMAWNIARSATSLWELVTIHGVYEGHTPFWYAVLWPFAKTGNPDWMLFVSASLVLIAAILLMVDQAFNRWVTILIVFGYYFVYEYSIISRPYALTLVLSALLASAIYNKWGNYPIHVLLCAMIGFTSSFGAVMSVSIMLLVTIENSYSEKPFHLNKLYYSIIISLYAAAVALSIYIVVFPILDLGSGSHELNILTGKKYALEHSFVTIKTAVFPHVDRLPLGLGDFFSQSITGVTLINMAALAAVVSVAILLSNYQHALLVWIFAVVSMSIAINISGSQSERHLGHIYIIALTLLWAKPRLTKKQLNTIYLKKINCFHKLSNNPLAKKMSAFSLILVLIYHFFIGIAVAGFDVIGQLTPLEYVEEFLTDEYGEEFTLLTDDVMWFTPLLAELDIEAYDTACQCWTRYKRRELHAGLASIKSVESAWCDLTNKGHTVVGAFSRTEWTNNLYYRSLGDFPAGAREFTKPPELFQMTPLMIQRCANNDK